MTSNMKDLDIPWYGAIRAIGEYCCIAEEDEQKRFYKKWAEANAIKKKEEEKHEEVSLATLIDEIDRMKSLINKLKTYNREEGVEGIFAENVELSREDARLAQRCVQSYMDILLEQKVKVGDY